MPSTVKGGGKDVTSIRREMVIRTMGWNRMTCALVATWGGEGGINEAL